MDLGPVRRRRLQETQPSASHLLRRFWVLRISLSTISCSLSFQQPLVLPWCALLTPLDSRQLLLCDTRRLPDAWSGLESITTFVHHWSRELPPSASRRLEFAIDIDSTETLVVGFGGPTCGRSRARTDIFPVNKVHGHRRVPICKS